MTSPQEELDKANAERWKTLPPAHPAALLFPMMSDAEIDKMADDIKKNGLKYSTVFWEDNTEAKNGAKGPFSLFLLDGRNRIEALRRLGDIKYVRPNSAFSPKSVSTVSVVRAIKQPVSLGLGGARSSVGKWVPDVDPWEYVMSVNAHRRHLTSEQKRDAIDKFIKERPQASNRKIAKALKVSHPFVAKVRKESVPNGNDNHLDEHLPRERAEKAVKANPTASVSEIAEAAKVGRATAQRAKETVRKITEAELLGGKVAGGVDKTTEPKPVKAKLHPEAEILRQAFKALRVPKDVFRKWAIEIHGLNVSEPLFRGYVDEAIGNE